MNLLVNINHSCDLLPQFIRHYRHFGIKRFLVGVPHGEKNPMWETIAEHFSRTNTDAIIEKMDVEPEAVYQGRRDCYDQNIRRQKYIYAGWYWIADLDEFIVMPELIDAKAAVGIAEYNGFMAIAGGMFDRFTADGTLPEDFTYYLWQQFPVCIEATKHMVKGNASKMVAARWDVEIGPGHHVYETPEKKHYWIAQVHHFKWGANLAAVQKLRIEEYKDKGLVYEESVHVLEHLKANNGRINVEQLIRQDMAHRLRLSREIVELREKVAKFSGR